MNKFVITLTHICGKHADLSCLFVFYAHATSSLKWSTFFFVTDWLWCKRLFMHWTICLIFFCLSHSIHDTFIFKSIFIDWTPKICDKKRMPIGIVIKSQFIIILHKHTGFSFTKPTQHTLTKYYTLKFFYSNVLSTNENVFFSAFRHHLIHVNLFPDHCPNWAVKMKKGGLDLVSQRRQHILNRFRMTMTFAKELSSTYVNNFICCWFFFPFDCQALT